MKKKETLKEFVARSSGRDRMMGYIFVSLVGRRTDGRTARDAAIIVEKRITRRKMSGEELNKRVEEYISRFKAWEKKRCNSRKMAQVFNDKIVGLLDSCGFKKVVARKIARYIMIGLQLDGKDLSKTEEFEDYVADRVLAISNNYIMDSFKY